jgi:hypothetical protein
MMDIYRPKEKHFIISSMFEEGMFLDTDNYSKKKISIVRAIRMIYTFKRSIPKAERALAKYGISRIRQDIELAAPEEEWLGQELIYGIGDLAIKFSGRRKEYDEKLEKLLSTVFTKIAGFKVGFDEGNLMDQRRGWLIVKAFFF